jgi:hypothetical protein
MFNALSCSTPMLNTAAQLQILFHRCNRILYLHIMNSTMLTPGTHTRCHGAMVCSVRQPPCRFAANREGEFVRPAKSLTQGDCAAKRVTKQEKKQAAAVSLPADAAIAA